MQGLVNYKVTCKKCKKTSKVGIINDRDVLWNDGGNIISARRRLDGQWGWQCGVCNNNDILTRQEQRAITNKQNPDKKEIADILKNLIPDKPKFEMERA